MKRFHFSLGDSNLGAIGFCAVAHAETEEEAVAALKSNLPESVTVQEGENYIEIYLNPVNITVDDIDDIDGV